MAKKRPVASNVPVVAPPRAVACRQPPPRPETLTLRSVPIVPARIRAGIFRKKASPSALQLPSSLPLAHMARLPVALA